MRLTCWSSQAVCSLWRAPRACICTRRTPPTCTQQCPLARSVRRGRCTPLRVQVQQHSSLPSSWPRPPCDTCNSHSRSPAPARHSPRSSSSRTHTPPRALRLRRRPPTPNLQPQAQAQALALRFLRVSRQSPPRTSCSSLPASASHRSFPVLVSSALLQYNSCLRHNIHASTVV